MRLIHVPQHGLEPSPVALVYQWSVFAMTAAVLEVFVARRGRIDKGVEDALDDSDYLVTGSFTVEDLVCGAVLMFGRRAELTKGLPRIAGYLDRLGARP